MSEKSTPDRWEIRETNFNDIEIRSPDRLIARVYKYDSVNADANAHLMVTAPELLEALQFALERLKIVEKESDYDHRTFHQGIAIDKAIAAIKKATGEQK